MSLRRFLGIWNLTFKKGKQCKTNEHGNTMRSEFAKCGVEPTGVMRTTSCGRCSRSNFVDSIRCTCMTQSMTTRCPAHLGLLRSRRSSKPTARLKRQDGLDRQVQHLPAQSGGWTSSVHPNTQDCPASFRPTAPTEPPPSPMPSKSVVEFATIRRKIQPKTMDFSTSSCQRPEKLSGQLLMRFEQRNTLSAHSQQTYPSGINPQLEWSHTEFRWRNERTRIQRI